LEIQNTNVFSDFGSLQVKLALMGLRPTQGDENRLKGAAAFRPSVTITITLALEATEGNIFDKA